jgi:hypothetical protein
MTAYEYKVVPAPVKGQKARGVRGAEARFAYALQQVMNTLGADGWEYQRTDTLPSEERSGLASSTTTYRNVMVFRRARKDDLSAFKPQLLEHPRTQKLPAPAPEPAVISATSDVKIHAPITPVSAASEGDATSEEAAQNPVFPARVTPTIPATDHASARPFFDLEDANEAIDKSPKIPSILRARANSLRRKDDLAAE